MVTKKKVKRVRKKVVHKKARVKKVSKQISAKNKVGLVVRKLLLFLVLFAVSFVLYNAVTKDALMDFFGVLAILFGILSLTFVLVLLVLLFLRIFK